MCIYHLLKKLRNRQALARKFPKNYANNLIESAKLTKKLLMSTL